jgi:3-deoxy-D-manno-octulosonic-acid transferase
MIGPSTFNFAQAARLAIDAGSAVQVADADEAIAAAARLLSNAAARDAMHEAGLRFTEAHRGATARTLELIASRV